MRQFYSFIFLIVLLVLAVPSALALGVNSTGSASVVAGSLTPGGSVMVRFEVTPVADSAMQNDFADGFYAMLPSGWQIDAISPAPAGNSAEPCGTNHTIDQLFGNSGDYPFAYWGHLEGTVDVDNFRIPAGSECGVYEAPQMAGDTLTFEVTASIPPSHPTCGDGSAEIPADPNDPNSFFGVLVSDGYAANSGTWIDKNYTISFANECPPPTAITLVARAVSTDRPLWMLLFGTLLVVTLFTRRNWRGLSLVVVLGMTLVAVSWVRATPPSQGYNSTGHDLADAGEYDAAQQSISMPRDVSSGGGTISAEFFYPANGTSYDPAGAPYPAIIFAHGFLQGYDRYQSLLEHFATHGYFVVALADWNNFSVNHQTYSEEVQDAITYLETINADAGDPFFGQIMTTAVGVTGHSMGGGAVVQAAGNDARINAVAPLAPAQLNNNGADAIAAALGIEAPTMIVVGGSDTIVPANGNGQDMFDNVPVGKQIVTVDGADHCDFQDSVFPWRGTIYCGALNNLPDSEGRAISRRLLTGFFNLHLKSADRAHWRLGWGPEKSADSALSTVTLDPQIDLSATTTAQTSTPNTTVDYPLTITNTGDTPFTYTIIASANRWATSIDQASLTLNPSESGMVTITVTLPAGAKQVTEDTVIVSVESTENIHAYLELTTTLEE